MASVVNRRRSGHRSRTPLTMSALAAALLAGCGLHLHNPADEALARQAADAFKAADLPKLVESERAIVRAAHERDLAVTQRNIDAECDAMLVVALGEGRD